MAYVQNSIKKSVQIWFVLLQIQLKKTPVSYVPFPDAPIASPPSDPISANLLNNTTLLPSSVSNSAALPSSVSNSDPSSTVVTPAERSNAGQVANGGHETDTAQNENSPNARNESEFELPENSQESDEDDDTVYEDIDEEDEEMEVATEKLARKRGLKENFTPRSKKLSKLNSTNKRTRAKLFPIKPGSQVTRVKLPSNMKSDTYFNNLGLGNDSLKWAEATDIESPPQVQDIKKATTSETPTDPLGSGGE